MTLLDLRECNILLVLISILNFSTRKKVHLFCKSRAHMIDSLIST